ncbi:MAG: CPBP family intramembrane metalloprotease [Labilithrix sp.]|nr:CPBP family intramembrane metalloprotease [Labilithrix sp.]
MIRSTAALALLLFRYWARASLPSRLRRDKARRASAGLFRIAYFAMMSAWGYAVGRLVAALGDPAERARGVAWIIVGTMGLSVIWTALTRGPTLRGEPSPLETTFLDALPLREESRLAVGLIERLFLHALGAAALVGAVPEAPARAVLSAIALSTTGVFTGEALMRVARIVVPAMTIARARTYLLVLGQAAFLMCIVQAPSLAKSARAGVLVAGWPAYVVRAIAEGEGFPLVLAVTACALALAIAGNGVAERIGYDRVDLVPTGRPRRARQELLVVDRVDDVLRRREPGGRWAAIVMMIYTAVVSVAIVGFAWSARRAAADQAAAMIRGACGLAAFGAFVVVTARASRMAARDVAARPLLAPLPIEPRDLLGGNVRRLRRDALLVALPAVLLLATPWPVATRIEVAWRVGSLLLAVVLAGKAAASIAFLTVGAGSRRGPGASFVVESVLVLVPLVGVVTAPYAWAVVVPLGALGLVAREAGRSGLRCVRWLDDGDDFERETPIWRALLVLAAFQSAEVLTGRLVGLSELEEATKVAIAYGASSLVLVALTLHARRAAPQMRLLPERPAWLAAGAALGLLTGAAAAGYVLLARRLGADLPELTGVSRAAVAITAVGVAPFAEEMFFRGWLYGSIEDELSPSRRRWLAPLLGAFAFAAVHPPLAFAPMFVLGLVAGLLFARTRAIGPAIVAHLVHNGLALVLAG